MNPFKIILAIVCFVIALYNLDFHDINRSIVAVLLFLQGIWLISSNEKVTRIVRGVSLFLAIFLIMKIITGG